MLSSASIQRTGLASMHVCSQVVLHQHVGVCESYFVIAGSALRWLCGLDSVQTVGIARQIIESPNQRLVCWWPHTP